MNALSGLIARARIGVTLAGVMPTSILATTNGPVGAGTLVDPQLHQCQLQTCHRRLTLGRHERLLRAAARLENQAVLRFAWHDGRSAFAALDEQLVTAHVELAFLVRAAVAHQAAVFQNGMDLFVVEHSIGAFELGGDEGLSAGFQLLPANGAVEMARMQIVNTARMRKAPQS